MGRIFIVIMLCGGILFLDYLGFCRKPCGYNPPKPPKHLKPPPPSKTPTGELKIYYMEEK